MPDQFEEWLHSGPGRITVITVLIITLAAGAWTMQRYFGPDSAKRFSDNPLFIDSVTGKAFHYDLKTGDTIPVMSPFTGHNTGYPAAFSYWSRGGRILRRPEPVLLNSWLGKAGPTFAPLSGRMVTAHEKPPRPGSPPPPTRAQYEKWLHRDRVASVGGS